MDSWAALEAHLSWWMREVADCRLHSTTGEPPIERFQRERAALLPPGGRPSFVQVRELTRVVSSDLGIEVDTNHTSVPWPPIGEPVSGRIDGQGLRVFHAGAEVARHPLLAGRRQRHVEQAHRKGLSVLEAGRPRPGRSELERPLAEYAAVVGGTP